jgi:hypothetical protein
MSFSERIGECCESYIASFFDKFFAIIRWPSFTLCLAGAEGGWRGVSPNVNLTWWWSDGSTRVRLRLPYRDFPPAGKQVRPVRSTSSWDFCYSHLLGCLNPPVKAYIVIRQCFDGLDPSVNANVYRSGSIRIFSAVRSLLTGYRLSGSRVDPHQNM